MEYGRYRFIPFTWVINCPSKEKDKTKIRVDDNGDEKKGTIVRSLRYVYCEVVTPNGDGQVWVYTGMSTKTKPLSYSDSLDHLPGAAKAKRLTPLHLQAEITRRTSAAFAAEVVAAIDRNLYKDERGFPGVARQTVADLLGCTLVPVENEDGYETLKLTGGLIGRIADQLAKAKTVHAQDVKMWRR